MQPPYLGAEQPLLVQDQAFVDALPINNIAGVTDREQPSQVKIVWSRDFLAAALMTNLAPPVFDFRERVGYAESSLGGTRGLFFGEE